MKTRDVYYDNAKFLLIFFVVFGHFIQSYIDNDHMIYALYVTIYTFHMPAFILISGFFAKGFYKKGYLKKITKKLIIPYLIFQGIYSFYYYFINEHQEIELNPLHPQWSLWFLISLFCWNIMLFLFTKWKAWVALSISIALGIIAGYFNEIDDFLSLSRTFVFFPFFLLGYYIKKEYFEKIGDAKYRYMSFAILLTLLIVIYYLPEFNYKWLFGSKSYEVLNASDLNGGLIRLAVYGVTLLATLSFLALVPRKKYFFTNWGISSVYVYLLHGFFIKYFRNSDWVNILEDTAVVIVFIIVSVLLIAFLSSNMIRKIAQPLIELKASYFKMHSFSSGHEKR
nr:acyltransferase family protein [uncultured Bacillus sp.]